MQVERFKVVPAVYLILAKDGKVLLLRRYQTGYQDGNYSMIAGHLDGGEMMKDAMVREAFEEAGIKISPKDLTYVLTMYRICPTQERLDVFFTVKRWQREIKNMEPEKCDDLSWFSIDNLPKNIVPYVKEAIRCYQEGTNYCEFRGE